MNPITRSDAAQALGYSDSYLSVLFRRFDDLGFHQTLSAMRMQRARALLMDRQLSIAAVAERSGFENPTTFTRVFMRAEGVRPSQWRLNQPQIIIICSNQFIF